MAKKLASLQKKLWPQGYVDLFGSLRNLDLKRPRQSIGKDRKRQMIKIFILINFIMVGMGTEHIFAGGCKENQDSVIAADATLKRNLFNVDKPLYFSDNEGRFYKTKFNDLSQELIFDHASEGHVLDIRISPNGRFFIYQVSDLEKSPDLSTVAHYYIYDAQTNKDTKLLDSKLFDMKEMQFSPDGMRLAVMSTSPREEYSTLPENAGVYIYEAGTLKMKFFPVTPKTEKIKWRRTMHWSKDGKYLFFMVNVIGRQGVMYYKLELETGAVYSIDEKEIEKVGYNRKPQYREQLQSVATNDNTVRAQLDRQPSGKYLLNIYFKDAGIIKVAEGDDDECFGVSLKPLGWISNDFLVFGDDSSKSTQVFDVKQRKTVRFFASEVPAYFWLD